MPHTFKRPLPKYPVATITRGKLAWFFVRTTALVSVVTFAAVLAVSSAHALDLSSPTTFLGDPALTGPNSF